MRDTRFKKIKEGDTMNELGTLRELNGRYVIRFEHFFLINRKLFSNLLQILIIFHSGILLQQEKWI
jgi:hypothetical protein